MERTVILSTFCVSVMCFILMVWIVIFAFVPQLTSRNIKDIEKTLNNHAKFLVQHEQFIQAQKPAAVENSIPKKR